MRTRMHARAIMTKRASWQTYIRTRTPREQTRERLFFFFLSVNPVGLCIGPYNVRHVHARAMTPSRAYIVHFILTRSRMLLSLIVLELPRQMQFISHSK